MANSEERKMILRMVEEGKISAEDGARLLAALNETEDGAPLEAVTTPAIGNSSRFLHVRITDIVTGKEKVRVNIPVGLVAFGLRFVPESAGINLHGIREAVENGYTGGIVDVYDEEDGQHIEVYLQ